MTVPPTPAVNIIEVGPRPYGSQFPRWVQRADVPDDQLPPVGPYECPYVAGPVIVDGDVDSKNWQWSSPFRHMATGTEVPFSSRFALGWNEQYLFAAFDFVDPGREAIATEAGTHVYAVDTAAELLIGGANGYYEIGVNSIGTFYELDWRWVAPIIESDDLAGLDRLFRLPNFLYFAPQGSDRVGRVGDLDYHLPGLALATQWSDRGDKPGWTAEMALPWSSLSTIFGTLDDGASPEGLRAQAMRAHHPAPEAETDDLDDSATKPTEGWTWSVQGNGNVHNLSRWTPLILARDGALLPRSPEDLS